MKAHVGCELSFSILLLIHEDTFHAYSWRKSGFGEKYHKGDSALPTDSPQAGKKKSFQQMPERNTLLQSRKEENLQGCLTQIDISGKVDIVAAAS
jgi:hypothetical protein